MSHFPDRTRRLRAAGLWLQQLRTVGSSHDEHVIVRRMDKVDWMEGQLVVR